VTTKYPLEPLIKAREWELEELRTRLAQARAAVDAAERAVRGLADEIAAAEADALRDSAQARSIQIDKRRIAALYLRDRQERLRDERDALAAKRAALASAAEAVTAVRRSIRALERHKERLCRRGEELAASKLQKTMDDLWLGRRRP
jgi:flagellar biosynthesis chaperone FliJ